MLKVIHFYIPLFGYQVYFYNHLIKGAWEYRFFPAELPFFAIGILSFRFYQKIKTLLDLNIWSRLSKLLLITMLVVTVFYALLCDTYPTVLKYTYFSLIFFAVPCFFHHTKANKVDQFLGDLSFPTYINHVFVIWILEGMGEITMRTTVVASVSIVFAFFMKKYLIDPIDKIRMKRSNMLIRNQ